VDLCGLDAGRYIHGTGEGGENVGRKPEKEEGIFPEAPGEEGVLPGKEKKTRKVFGGVIHDQSVLGER